jgi:hypothetical protein
MWEYKEIAYRIFVVLWAIASIIAILTEVFEIKKIRCFFGRHLYIHDACGRADVEQCIHCHKIHVIKEEK